MTTEKITIELRLLESLREMQKFEGGRWQRRIGMLYFHQMPDGHFVMHLLSEKTNGEWMIKMVNEKRIYVPKERIEAERA
jgi:hypothetical protein